jgi:hypothetical protein
MRVVVPLPRQMSELTGALRSHRTGTMVQAMLLGGLRRREVLGLRLCDVDPGEKPPGRDLGGSHEHRCSHGRAICHRFVGFGLMLFVPAGTLHYWQAWVFLAVFTIAPLSTVYLVRKDPAVV